jgi:hypothetical protein
MSSLNAGESTASQSFALTCRGLFLFFGMIGGHARTMKKFKRKNPGKQAAQRLPLRLRSET